MRYLRPLPALLLSLVLVLLSALPAVAAPGDLAVYFGSFDPPHNGHMAVVRGVLPDLGIDRVILVPTRGIAGKEHEASFEHRYAMCEQLARWYKGMEVLPRDLIDRTWAAGGPTGWRRRVYEALYPRLGFNALVLDIMGMDRFNQLLRTRTYPARQEPRMVVVVDRPGFPLDTDLVEESGVPPGKFLFLHPNVLDIQSAEVRTKLRAGEDVAGEVPFMVRRYIRKHGLYGR